MCKILTVVVAFLWVLANSTLLGRDSLPLVLILLTTYFETHVKVYMRYTRVLIIVCELVT